MSNSETNRQLAQLRQRVANLERILEDITLNPTKITEMSQYAAEQFDLSHLELLGPCRKAGHVSARIAIVYAARHLGFTLVAIARRLGKDHSSIAYLYNNYEARLASYPEHRDAMLTIVEKFKP